MIFHCRWAGMAACLLFLIPAYADTVSFPVTGVYDGAAIGNQVDKSAGFYAGNSSGAGDDESLILEIDQFRHDILVAFSNQCGGVVGFDNAVIVGGAKTDSFAATFGEKSLAIKNVDHVRTDYSTDNCAPVSGPADGMGGGFLTKSNVNEDQITIRSSYDFSFTEDGFSPGEHVHAVGGTILARNGSRPASKWLMKVLLDNGDMISAIADIDFSTGKARDDTFFGACAPAGRYITGVAWICLDGSFSGLDSFAFITDGAVVEESVPATDLPGDATSVTNGAASTNEDYSLLFGY